MTHDELYYRKENSVPKKQLETFFCSVFKNYLLENYIYLYFLIQLNDSNNFIYKNRANIYKKKLYITFSLRTIQIERTLLRFK